MVPVSARYPLPQLRIVLHINKPPTHFQHLVKLFQNIFKSICVTFLNLSHLEKQKKIQNNVVGVDIRVNIAFFILVRRSLLRLPSVQVVAHSGIIGTLFRYSSSPTHNSSMGGLPVSLLFVFPLDFFSCFQTSSTSTVFPTQSVNIPIYNLYLNELSAPGNMGWSAATRPLCWPSLEK